MHFRIIPANMVATLIPVNITYDPLNPCFSLVDCMNSSGTVIDWAEEWTGLLKSDR